MSEKGNEMNGGTSTVGELQEQSKTDHLRLLDEIAEEVLAGQVTRLIVVAMAPDGTLSCHARGGFVTDTIGALGAAQVMLMRHTQK